MGESLTHLAEATEIPEMKKIKRPKRPNIKRRHCFFVIYFTLFFIVEGKNLTYLNDFFFLLMNNYVDFSLKRIKDWEIIKQKNLDNIKGFNKN